MQGYLETLLLKEATLDTEARRQYLNIAWKHTQRLSRLVTELFELSKLDAGRVEPHFEKFSLAELLQDVVQKFYLEAERKQIQLRYEGNDGMYYVYAVLGASKTKMDPDMANQFRETYAVYPASSEGIAGQIEILRASAIEALESRNSNERNRTIALSKWCVSSSSD